MNKAYLPDPLNKQASILVDAQTDIKLAIKNGILSGKPSFIVKEKIRGIIDRALNHIDSPVLKNNAKISLMRCAPEKKR